MVGGRFALIVAADDYAETGLRRLAAPIRDAAALAETLSDPHVGDFHVDVITNQPAHRVREDVEQFFADRRPVDLLLLHFSCHGLKDQSGELFLAATNTNPSLLGSTAVDAAFVSRLMRRSRARRAVLTLDCCYGGAFERGLVPRAAGVVDVGAEFDQRDAGGGRGRVIITASSAVEYAFEDAELVDASAPVRPSLFTGAFVEGLATGAADLDGDGYVSLDELYDFMYDRVREQTPHQTPSKWEFGLQGGLVIARAPHSPDVPDAEHPPLTAAQARPETGDTPRDRQLDDPAVRPGSTPQPEHRATEGGDIGRVPLDGIGRAARILATTGVVGLVLGELAAFRYLQADGGWRVPLLPVSTYRAWSALPGLLPVIGAAAAAAVLLRRGGRWARAGTAMAVGVSLSVLSLLAVWVARGDALREEALQRPLYWITVAGALSFVAAGLAAILAGLRDGSLTVPRWTAWRPADGLPAALLACAVYAYWNNRPALNEGAWAPFAAPPRLDLVDGAVIGVAAVVVAAGVGMLRPRRFAGVVLVTWLGTWFLGAVWQLVTAAMTDNITVVPRMIALQVGLAGVTLLVGLDWIRTTDTHHPWWRRMAARVRERAPHSGDGAGYRGR